MKFLSIPLILLCFCIGTIEAQIKDSVLDYELKLIIKEVIKVVKNKYIFPDVAHKIAHKIENSFENGLYNKLNKEKLAKAITKDIFTVSNDKHNVFVTRIYPKKKKTPSQALNQYNTKMHNNGIKEVKILSGNIGYFKYDGFEGLNASKNGLKSAFQLLKNVDALIFDLSDNKGGSPITVQFISSFFFSKKTLLNRQHWRENNEVTELWSLELFDSLMFDKIPMVVIVSKQTASAAESFSYIMKHNKKAIIVGSRTSGGAHMAEVFTIKDDFLLQLSIGRAMNPITNSNWEGTGVIPNIETSKNNALKTSRELLLDILIKKTSDKELRNNYMKVLKATQ